MRLTECQSKKLLAKFGLAVTEPIVVKTAEDAAEVAEKFDRPVVIKAQVPFGGRGKLGAVAFADTSDAARAEAKRILALNLRGTPVEQISVELKLEFEQQIYIGITWDTAAKVPVALIHLAGGVEIEQADQQLMARRPFNPINGLQAYEAREMASKLGLGDKALVRIGQTLARLAKAFIDLDALTAEINPLVQTPGGALIGLDAHLEIDDDARYRQQAHLESLGQVDSHHAGRPPTDLEREAQRIDSMDHRGVAGRMVEFDGNLGLLIGGGGASLTIFDAIRRHGGKPANYCEMGGNPTEEKVAALTALLLSKPAVRKLAVIMNVVNNTRADVMARGVVMGIKRSSRKPAEVISVFRIPGSWEDEARQIMTDAGIEALGRETSLDAAARLAVERMHEHAA